MQTAIVPALEPLNVGYKTVPQDPGIMPRESEIDFGTIFDAARNLVNETNDLQNKANSEQLKFALGASDNAHDVMVAARKASIALQYTNAIRSQVVQGYQTIMNMQI